MNYLRWFHISVATVWAGGGEHRFINVELLRFLVIEIHLPNGPSSRTSPEKKSA